jgi:iron complex outermembrane receptor protein
MRRVHTLLWSTTALAVFSLSSPAFAKKQPAVPPDPNATAQQEPGQPAQNADAPQSPATATGTTNPDEGQIVVTGLRRALQSARNIKRNSDQIVDAVVAEDIGKLPDITVSDTAARIPGVQVERSGGEANRVLLRGLDNTYYTTTYNGREIFTAETRSVALQDFPAGAIAAVEAFKTSTANLVEPGIAGLLNVRSRRPFDFPGLEVSGSVWALHPNQSRDTSLNGNLLLSDRWLMGNGEFGALINFSYTRIHYQDSVRRHGFFIANLDGGRSPDWPEIHYNEGDRWRPSVNGSLQYRNGDLELYFDGLWQGYRERVTDRMFAEPLWNGGQAVYSNIVFRPGTNEIVSGTVQNPGCPTCAWGFQGATHRETNTYQFAGGGSYDAGPLRISADLAHTSSHFQLRTESVDEQLATNQYTVNWFTGKPGGPGPTFQVEGLDFTDPANYQYRGFFEDYQDPRGKDWQARVDFDYDTRLTFLPKIQWGARYVDRDASDVAGSFYWNAGGLGVPISAVPLNYILHNPAFRGDDLKPIPLTWLSPTYDSVWSDLRGFRQFNIDLLGFGSLDGPPVDPGRSFDINEKTLAGYAQANFRVGEGDVYADGILGVRVVRTKDDIRGTQFSPTAPPSPIDFRNHYTDWLPNLNINVHMGRPWVLRLAATKTITRPTFQQLNPSFHLDQVPGCEGQPSGCFRTASGGNPFLDPLRSNNYDASLEYYFTQTGYASVGVFRRDMKGFIVNRQFEFPNPDPETGLPLLFTGPENSSKARLQGFEAQIRTFFDWGFVPSWLRAFGLDANVSYLKANVVQDVIAPTPPSNAGPGLPAVTRYLPIPDVSKWTWNLTGMYESGPLSVRLSYNRRSRYWEGGLSLQQDGSGFYTLQGHARQSPRLDLSASYNVNDRFTLFFDWTNILGHPFQSDIVRVNYGPTRAGVPISTEVFPMVIRYEERILSGGIRFNFGGPKHEAAAPAPAYVPPPPPPPPVVEQPAPPPPPPPPTPTERGERGS